MEWRSFWQRIILFALLAALIIGLIAAGIDANVALAIAAALVVLLKDMWIPGMSGDPSIEQHEDGSPERPATRRVSEDRATS